MVISKSILSDNSDDSNSALAMAFLATATSTGLVLGPSIGGAFLYNLCPYDTLLCDVFSNIVYPFRRCFHQYAIFHCHFIIVII